MTDPIVPIKGRPGQGWLRACHVVLNLGAEGPMVGHLQELLELTVTGVFDTGTEDAVKAKQLALSLPETGVVSAPEWAALHPVVAPGSVGTPVFEVQHELAVVEDGKVDVRLTDAIAAFRTAQGWAAGDWDTPCWTAALTT